MAEQRTYGGGRGGFNRQPQDEFKDKVLDLRRVTRVVAGGKRFRFRATVVIGDSLGRVGVGVGKSIDVPAAIAKEAGRSDLLIMWLLTSCLMPFA